MNNFIFIFLIFFFQYFYSNEIDEKSEVPLDLTADELVYDKINNNITANGNVYVRQDVFFKGKRSERVLRSDKITYYVSQDKIVAEGNVWLYEPSNDVMFSDAITVKNKMKDGIANNLKVLMSDESKLSACSVQKFDKKNIFKKALYSPCKIYKGQKNPTWQIKAEEVVHDTENKTMKYKNARIEFLGFPVFYTPYFKHPDPSVKRKSGILFPSYGSTTDLGKYVALPYYIVIDKHQDLTITPFISSRQGVVLSAEYRKRFYNGNFYINGSATKTKKLHQTPKNNISLEKGSLEVAKVKSPKNERWHIFSGGNYHISDSKKIEWEIKRASDTTYLRRYPIIEKGSKLVQDKSLNSFFSYDDFQENSYFTTKSYLFQTDTPKTTPAILPFVRYNKYTEPLLGEGFASFDASALSIVREDNITEEVPKGFHRIALKSGFHLPNTTSGGHVLQLNMNLHTHAYVVQSYQRVNSKEKASFETLRVHPMVDGTWKFPLINDFDSNHGVLEPTASIHLSEKTDKNSIIPNEDSRIVEIDDTNIFGNRFTGIDRLESGKRGVFGFNYRHSWLSNQSAEIFLGQSRRLDKRSVIGKNDGEDEKSSDYVTRFYLQMNEYIEFQHRSSFFRKNLHPRYMETKTEIGPKKFKLGVIHTYINTFASEQNQTLSQVTTNVNWNVYESWHINASQTKNLKDKSGGTLSNRIAFIFQNDCFAADLTFYQNSFKDRDIAPDKGFLFKITFKNIGTFNVA